jgi:hypothetical protein
MEINYCLKKGKGKGNLYLPSFVVTLFCRRALMSSRSYVAALLCRRAFMSPRSYVAALLCRTLFCRALFLRRAFVAIPLSSSLQCISTRSLLNRYFGKISPSGNSYLRTKCGKTMFPHERIF